MGASMYVFLIANSHFSLTYCSLNGIGSGIAETAQGTITADIFFLHSRGKWNTLFWVANMGALMVSSVALQTPSQ
jgi:hypothetical protein